jgi:hypothetical protein
MGLVPAWAAETQPPASPLKTSRTSQQLTFHFLMMNDPPPANRPDAMNSD